MHWPLAWLSRDRRAALSPSATISLTREVPMTESPNPNPPGLTPPPPPEPAHVTGNGIFTVGDDGKVALAASPSSPHRLAADLAELFGHILGGPSGGAPSLSGIESDIADLKAGFGTVGSLASRVGELETKVSDIAATINELQATVTEALNKLAPSPPSGGATG
jgi:hypothetical protein